ncbi:MAG: hypothetical protein RM021_012700 [Nostoc sp. EkiNYC01]|nr:hypothetical protein [Nostoc sp. EkiNYC01]
MNYHFYQPGQQFNRNFFISVFGVGAKRLLYELKQHQPQYRKLYQHDSHRLQFDESSTKFGLGEATSPNFLCLDFLGKRTTSSNG